MLSSTTDIIRTWLTTAVRMDKWISQVSPHSAKVPQVREGSFRITLDPQKSFDLHYGGEDFQLRVAIWQRKSHERED